MSDGEAGARFLLDAQRRRAEIEAQEARELEAAMRRRDHDHERERLARMTRWQAVDERRKA